MRAALIAQVAPDGPGGGAMSAACRYGDWNGPSVSRPTSAALSAAAHLAPDQRLPASAPPLARGEAPRPWGLAADLLGARSAPGHRECPGLSFSHFVSF